MKTRRNFMFSGGMASAALLGSFPLQAVAAIASPAGGLSAGGRKLVILHTADFNDTGFAGVPQGLAGARRAAPEALLLHVGEAATTAGGAVGYDVTCPREACALPEQANDRIIRKGGFTVGVIAPRFGADASIAGIDTAAAAMRRVAGCQVVVLVSGLGFRNGQALDDIKLARGTQHVDIIIGARADNHPVQPLVLRNRDRREVLLQADSGEGFGFSSLELEFDAAGSRTSVAFNALCRRREAHA